MHVLHEHEEIKSGVAQSLHEASTSALAFSQANGIPLDAIMSQLALLRRQPPSSERRVGKDEDTDDGDSNRNDTYSTKLIFDSDCRHA
jgi:hypothetical protein